MYYDRHHGRVRAFPHKEGNYATHVYVAGASLIKRLLSSALLISLCMSSMQQCHPSQSLRECMSAHLCCSSAGACTLRGGAVPGAAQLPAL